MKDLLSKEYYCYKVHTSLTKSSAYPTSIDTHHFFKKENLGPPFCDFSKISILI